MELAVAIQRKFGDLVAVTKNAYNFVEGQLIVTLPERERVSKNLQLIGKHDKAKYVPYRVGIRLASQTGYPLTCIVQQSI